MSSLILYKEVETDLKWCLNEPESNDCQMKLIVIVEINLQLIVVYKLIYCTSIPKGARLCKMYV